MSNTAARTKVFVGYDSREDIAWQVCRHSLQRHASTPVDVIALRQPVLRDLGLYKRPVDATASTEFSLTRFLTPYLAANHDWAVFVDCDFLFTQDIVEMLNGLDQSKALYVVQHAYEPNHAVKMDGKPQTTYPRKNWSSFMVFNNRHPSVRALTPEVVNAAAPSYLHRFEWLQDDEIGALPLEWNFLVGEYPRPSNIPAAIHYTNGGPWFERWTDVDFGDLWIKERDTLEPGNQTFAA